MKATAIKSIAVSIYFGTCSQMLHAQLDLSKFEVGANAGALVYQGDLTPSAIGSYRTMKPAFGIFVSRLVSTSVSMRTNLVFGKLKGDDAKYATPAYRQQRNLNFHSPVFEISELVVWNPLGNRGEEMIKNFSPYIFGGAGFSILHIKRDWSKFNTQYFSAEDGAAAGLSIDAQHHPPRVIPVLPVGIGLSYPISTKLSVEAETSYRFMFTDYLDGFSKAANPSLNDHYLSHTIGITYHFGKKNRLDCPEIRN